MRTKEISMQYLAGIIDGEGCIGIECQAPFRRKDGTWQRKHNYYTPRLVVVNTSKLLMEILVKSFGGQYGARKHIEGHKTCYAWRCFGEKLEAAIMAIQPYLQIKHDQAEVVLELRKTVGKTGWYVSEELLQARHGLYLRCGELNKTGS